MRHCKGSEKHPGHLQLLLLRCIITPSQHKIILVATAVSVKTCPVKLLISETLEFVFPKSSRIKSETE